jgi:DNA-binding transcriptional ArsR family regulator
MSVGRCADYVGWIDDLTICGGSTVVDRPVAEAKAELFKALAHPARILVLEALAEGEFAVGELADRLGMELSHLSQQLAVLRRVDAVANRRVGSVVFYRLRDPRMTQLLFVAKELLVTSLQDNRDLLQRLGSATDTR